MRVAVINPLSDTRYRQFVNAHPDATIVHEPAWAAVLSEAFPACRLHYLLWMQDGDIAAACPGCRLGRSGRRWVALPFASACDPLMAAEVAAESLWQPLVAHFQETGIDEFEWHATEVGHRPPDPTVAGVVDDYINQVIPLDGGREAIWKKFHKTSVQQRIRRADHMGYDTRIACGPADVDDFFRLHILNRRRLGLPPLPKALFAAMWKHLQPSGFMTLKLLIRNGDAVASLILLHHRRSWIAEYTATDPKALTDNPNHHLYWHSMVDAIEDGAAVFDFGRTARDNLGLEEFKARWGALAIPLRYFQAPAPGDGSLPRRVARRLKWLVQHTPPAVLERVPNWYC
jgi:CelD/BcsL family acetyltransferase involved in cellulose biosynthesis